ncbi:MAG: DCC1-like thiol-disulfide oxidoreductase family protein [Rhodovibrionaceae bacterium]
MSKLPLRVVYDGECPFCSNYVKLTRLKADFAVELVDARREPEKAMRYGLDLNEGMVADLNGNVYHGADAVWLLSGLSNKTGLGNWVLASVFSSRTAARLFYPILRMGRSLTLKILGKPRL